MRRIQWHYSSHFFHHLPIISFPNNRTDNMELKSFLQAFIVICGVITLTNGQTFYSCNGVVYNYMFPGCTYPTTTTSTSTSTIYYSCNGVLSTVQNPLCTYNTAVTAAPITTTNVITGTSVTGTVTGTTSTGTTQYYLCNGVYYTFPNPACTYPTTTVTG